MKQELLTKVLVATAIALSGLTVASQPSYGRRAQGESGFWCSTSTGAPVTVYQNAQGAVEPWIEWTSDYFSGSGYNPATRCQLVSQRLETYRRQRMLKYITAGQMNGQNVICTANQVNGLCQNLIYTLRPGKTRSALCIICWLGAKDMSGCRLLMKPVKFLTLMSAKS